MKLLFILFAIILCGCKDPSHKRVEGSSYLTYKVVIIDGQEYYYCATRNGNFQLIPKAPAKLEK